MSAFNQTSGLKRIINAFGYSMQGLSQCFKYEAAFRQELALALVIIPLGLWLGDSGIAKAMLAGCWLLVILVEVINSAIEAAIDRFGEEQHELSGRAKDAGSAAVLIAISLAIMTWILVLFF